jgi:hypothetical protein
MTKREINQAITNANGALAWAREYIRGNDYVAAAAQLDAANIAVLLAKTRVNEYAASK